MVGIEVIGAIVAGITHIIIVPITLPEVRYCGAVVPVIPSSIIIIVVAGAYIANAVPIVIFLPRVSTVWTIVAAIADTVLITVSLVRIEDIGAVVVLRKDPVRVIVFALITDIVLIQIQLVWIE